MNDENKNLKTYLYVTSFNTDNEKKEAFIAVTKAILYVEVAVEMENFGDYGILFTSYHEINDINARIKKHGVHYLLLDITLNISMQLIVGMLPDFDLNQVKTLQIRAGNEISNEERIKHLEFYMQQATEDQKYELAVEIRDKIKSLNNKQDEK